MRVAIYSRKSKFTGKGDSIENQIEMCKDYINNKYKDNIEFTIYEDEGFSGSTINRPKFQKMIKDIKLNKFDILVCYRLDRISRNVADFSSTLEILQEHKVSFISIKEQFDTSTPIGKAMIYIASVFAQLERETIAERVKDNMIEMAKNGLWTGGKIPLGFSSKNKTYIDNVGLTREIHTLEINKNESKFVKFLYKKYLELGSLHKLEVYITENQLTSRNDIMFEKSSLKLILQNPIYVKANNDIIDYLRANDWKIYGEADGIHSLLTYNKTKQFVRNGKHIKIKNPKNERFAAVGKIKGFIDPELWLNVQKQFDKNRNTFPRLGKTNNALLTGKIKCGYCKKYMLVQHGRVSKSGKKLFYYVCSLKQKSHKKLCKNTNVRVDKIDYLVLLSLKKLFKSREKFINNLNQKYYSEPKNSGSDIKLELNAVLSSKEKQINRLTNALANGAGIENIIIDKIKTIKKECTEIENKLADIKNNHLESKITKLNLNIIENILNDCNIIDILPNEKKKIIINALIDNIYWFGNSNKDEEKIVINFIGSDKKSKTLEFEAVDLDKNISQFGSPCTCKTHDLLLPS